MREGPAHEEVAERAVVRFEGRTGGRGVGEAELRGRGQDLVARAVRDDGREDVVAELRVEQGQAEGVGADEVFEVVGPGVAGG